MRSVERQLRNASAPNEPAAEARAWAVASSVYAERRPAPRSRPRTSYLLAPVALVLAGVLALSPAGATVHRWIDQTLGVKDARRALFSLPTGGQLLVAGPGGVWTVQANGSKHRLGLGGQATWSPHALYVAVAQRNQLAALDPRGTTMWNIARPDVRFPRWYPPTGYRVAYLSGRDLRVIAGDGTGDRLLADGVTSVAPAWRPGHAYQLAYVARGRVVVRDADTGATAWSRREATAPQMLGWSADGRRLLVLTRQEAVVYDGSGRAILRVAGQLGLRDGAQSPDGRTLALLDAGGLTITDLEGHTRRVFSGVDLGQLAWSPDGRWLLVTWPAANQWVFIHVAGRPRITAVSRIAQQFSAFPSLEGWCCTADGGTAQ